MRLTISPALGGEDSGHHTATDTASGELGSDDGRQRVVTPDTETHDESPHDKHTVNAHTGSAASNGLAEGTDDDDHLRESVSGRSLDKTTYQLDTVHSLPAHMVGEVTKEELTEKRADGVGDLDAEVLVRGRRTAIVVHVANHRRRDGDGENVISVGKESHA